MKRALVLLIVLCMCFSFAACSYSEAELAEIETVKSSLKSYSWYKSSGAVLDVYEFNSNGTMHILSYNDRSGFTSEYKGTFEIDPSSNEIEIDCGSSFTFTYSLNGYSLTLYDSNGDQFSKTLK